jgi:hypothetical protein
MSIRLFSFVGVALAAGAGAAFFTADADGQAQAIKLAQQALAPISDLLAGQRDAQFFSPDPTTGAPTSAWDAFIHDHQIDPVAKGCFLDGDPKRTAKAVIMDHSHLATAGFVDCLLSRNLPRFCTTEGRAQAAAALELYYFARDNAEHPSHEHAMAQRINHLNDDLNGPTPGDDRDDHVWDAPADRAIVSDLQLLLRRGYLDAGAFGLFPRRQVRELVGETPREGFACAGPG